MRTKILLMVLSAIIYWVLVLYVPYGDYIVLPINLFVTFLHELGHSLFAIATGGSVHEVFIQSNGAGHAVTSGGFMPLILLGGYIGSALFGNLLLYVGICKPKTSVYLLYLIVAILLFTAIWWFSSVFTSVLLILFSALGIWLSRRSKAMVANLLLVIGTASVVYIIKDYNVGPSSDIAKFASIVPILPQAVWAIVWLLLVIWITYATLKKAFKA